MSIEAPPISSSEMTSRALRPTRSPKWPATIPPSGRSTTPTASVANEARVAPNAVWPGKNCTLNTSAAARP